MATTNGIDLTHETTQMHPVQLGKRKRSASSETPPGINGDDVASLQKSLNAALQESEQSDVLLSFLRQPLPDSSEPPGSKRLRLSPTDSEPDTIQKRIQSGAYQTQTQILEDVRRLGDSLVNGNQAKPNGHPTSDTPSGPPDVVNQFTKLLLHRPLTRSLSRSSIPKLPDSNAGQIIMLRSQTEKGVTLLYSGLQVPPTGEDVPVPVDSRRLPNGFDLIEPATMDPSLLAPPKQPRKFEDAFGPHRNVKALEMPRSRAAVRSNTLGFSSEPTMDRSAPMNRQDFKFQQLPTGSWLNYSKGHCLDDRDASRKYRDKTYGGSDFRAALIANDVAVNGADDSVALFKKAFSSFAPTSDGSKALISDQDRNRQWWRKRGSKLIHKLFKPTYPELDQSVGSAAGDPLSAEDFSDVVNYQPEEQEEMAVSIEEPQNIDDILDEISQLLETVHSYQRIRNLDSRASASSGKPTSDEFDTYDLLRSQLSILISSVPPFAVAKLDGDKLADLNISTNIMVEAADYRGTGQPDDFTLAKFRNTQPSPARPVPVPGPAVASATPRQPFQPAAPMARFNANLASYAQNLGIQAANYAQQRPPFSTPQAQRPFQPFQGTYSAQPTVAQFQRPNMNGYGNYGMAGSPPAHSPSFAQPPGQPQFQQRKQQPAIHHGYGSPTPPRQMVNGAQMASFQSTPQPQSQPQSQFQRPQTLQQQPSFSPPVQQPSPMHNGAVVNGN